MAKKAKQNGVCYVNKDGPFLNRNEKKGQIIFNQLNEIFERFTTDEKLLESLHHGDTQANESFNNQLAYLAPKSVNYSQSKSLHFRLAIAICFNNNGYEYTWTQIFNTIGMPLGSKTIEHLKIKDKRKQNKVDKSQTPDFKRKRQHKTNAKILERIYEERRIIENNLGDYGPGLAEEENKFMTRTVKRKKVETENGSEKRCKCGSSDHLRTSNLKCPLNKKNQKPTNVTYQNNPSNTNTNDVGSINFQQVRSTPNGNIIEEEKIFLDNKVNNREKDLEDKKEYAEDNQRYVSKSDTVYCCQECSDL